MAYAQIFNVFRLNVQQTATQFCAHKCKLAPRQVGLLVHARGVASTVARLTFRGGAGARSCAAPPLISCLFRAPRGVVSLHSTARNHSSPAERDRSVTGYRGGGPQPSAGQKVKEAGKDFTYLIVVLIGLGVTGGLLYVVFHELFASSSPNKVYGKAFHKVKLEPEVIGAFGEPIKCYGETTRRGRRQQVSHHEYLKDGLKHMRLKFYIEGSEPGLKGTVHSESKENPETGKYEFRYIFVEVDTYPRRTIVVEDNR